MVQYIPNTDPWSTLGALLGQGITQGFSEQRQAQQQASALNELGLPAWVSTLSPQIQAEVVKNQLSKQQLQELLAPSTQPSQDVVAAGEITEQITPSGQQKPSSRLQQLSDEQLVALSGMGGGTSQIAKAELDRRSKVEEREFKTKERLKEQGYKEVQDIYKELNQKRSKLDDLKLLSETLEDSIQKGNLGFFSLNKLADFTGIDALRSPRGAAFNSAVKEYFTADLSGISARGLNQFIEKVLLKSLPQIGQSREANQAVLDILKTRNDLIEKELDTYDQVRDEFEEKGISDRKVPAEVAKRMQVFARDAREDLKKKIENLEKPASKAKKFKSMPDASRFQGKTGRDTATGKQFRSQEVSPGKWEWVEIEAIEE